MSPIPRAWTSDEIDRVLSAADRLEGEYRPGLPKADFWHAFLQVGFLTGLPIGHLLGLTYERMSRLLITQQVLNEIDALGIEGSVVFGNVVDEEEALAQFEELLESGMW